MRAYIRFVTLFFAGGRYRLLIFLVFGFCTIGTGMWYDWEKFVRSGTGTIALAFGGVIFYGCAACVYGYLIYTKRWKTAFWDLVAKPYKR